MDELIKTLPLVIRAAGNAPEVLEAAALAAWKHATGAGMQHHAVATKLDGQTLIVAVRDDVWQRQLTSMRGQLLLRVNSLLGQALVKNIELRIQPQTFTIAALPKQESDDILNNEVPLELWSAASSIEDKQLKQKFLKAAVVSLRRNEER